jgi:peroxiredoxin
VTLTQPGPGGLVEVIGHTAAQVDTAGNGTPNLIVHFADERSAGNLAVLSEALQQSKRADAPTAIVAVVAENQIARCRYTPGIIYAEDSHQIWEQVFAVKHRKRPFTLILGPTGHLLFQHDGALDAGILAAALGKLLVVRPAIQPRLLATSLTLNQLSPNFLFAIAPGQDLTLRKLFGRAVNMIFWKSDSKPSIDAVLDLQKSMGKSSGVAPALLAINDGDTADAIAKVAKEHGLTATLVADHQRDIALAYGIKIWPTTVSLDARGYVKAIRYGRVSAAAASRDPVSKE